MSLPSIHPSASATNNSMECGHTEEAERKAQEAKKAFEAQKESQAKEVSKKPVISAEEKARLMQVGHLLPPCYVSVASS